MDYSQEGHPLHGEFMSAWPAWRHSGTGVVHQGKRGEEHEDLADRKGVDTYDPHWKRGFTVRETPTSPRVFKRPGDTHSKTTVPWDASELVNAGSKAARARRGGGYMYESIRQRLSVIFARIVNG